MSLYSQHLIDMIRRNFWQSLKKILVVAFRVILNFQKFKVTLNVTYRIFFKLCQKLRLIMFIKC